ncbi:MAG: hypothetical protein EXX96DRAFT_539673 [Benjaminiella poitrasii]|nr:MAG: hypothetical protein EXX96DRAFT_539673 [Benjaminiella poitrasii]
MLKKNGSFRVYLLVNFQASSLCPSCKSCKLEKWKHINNPCPYQRKKHSEVVCNGLIRKASDFTSKVVVEKKYDVRLTKLWNRDRAAAPNFQHILELRATGSRPLRFVRGSHRSNKRTGASQFQQKVS